MTTLQNIITGLKASGVIDATRVTAGFRFKDGLTPPYVAVLDFEQEPTYDTGGVAYRTATFRVVIIHKDCDQAETLAATVNTFIETSTSLTPKTMRCLQARYRSSQQDENLTQWGVEIVYELTENP